MSIANSVAERISAANDKISKIKAEIKVQLESDIKSIFDEMFDKYPGFNGFRFTAYTPYFNDGDVCEFGYNGYEFSVNDSFIPADMKEELYSYDGVWHEGFWRVPEGTEGTTYGDFISELMAIDRILAQSEDFIQIIWGDHIRVTFDRDGVRVDEYDHD